MRRDSLILFLFLFLKLGQDPILGGPKQITGVETQVASNDADQMDVSQDGEVSLELTNSILGGRDQEENRPLEEFVCARIFRHLSKVE